VTAWGEEEMPMTLLLNRAELEKILDASSVIQAVEGAFADFSSGKVTMPVRTAIRVADPPGVMLVMPCAMTESRALGTKIVSVFPQNPARGLATIGALYVLLDFDTGFPIAVMDAGFITGLRTAAASAVATTYLAREDSKTLGIFGTGVQGLYHALAVPVVRNVEKILVRGSSLPKAQAFIEKLKGSVDAELVATDSIDEVASADIVVTGTTQATPLFSGRLLKPGAHVNNVGSHALTTREMDTEAVVRSTVVVDSYDACWAESGDIMIPIEEGAITREHVVAELGEIVAGKKPGRKSADELTLFKSNGLAFQDAVTAALALDRAKAAGVGTEFNFG
jgi:ornithine cyclodeaminase/alanine dehydrogenase-like protein (mu-crystallin family)